MYRPTQQGLAIVVDFEHHLANAIMIKKWVCSLLFLANSIAIIEWTAPSRPNFFSQAITPKVIFQEIAEVFRAKKIVTSISKV